MSFILSGLADEASRLPDRQIAVHKRLGWSEIELRSLWGRPLAELNDDEVSQVSQLLEVNNMRARIAGSRIGNYSRPIQGDFNEDITELHRFGAIAPRLGIEAIRIMSYPNGQTDSDMLSNVCWRAEVIERIKQLTGLAEGYGITLLHENCVGWAAQGPDETIDLLDTVRSEHLSLLFDIGNCVYYGQDALKFFEAVRSRIAHIHIKDAVRRGEETEFLAPGMGEADLEDIIGKLLDDSYQGIFSIEPHIMHRPHTGETANDLELESSYIAYAEATEKLINTLAGC